MRCLVTGGAGFIGFHLCRALLLRGIEVTVLDDSYTTNPESVREALRLLQRQFGHG